MTHIDDVPERHDPEGIVGARLRLVRIMAGQTQVEMSASVGADQSAWSKYEQGKRLIPLRMALRFAGKYRVSLDFVYQGSARDVDPSVAAYIRFSRPDLLREETKSTAPGMDTALASYRAAIGRNPPEED